MKTYEPAIGWVLLQAEELAEQTPGGIIKPQAALEKERTLGADVAPAFLVLKTGSSARFGIVTNDKPHYPAVGTKVFVLNKPMSIVVLNKHTLLVHLDAICGSVAEENA